MAVSVMQRTLTFYNIIPRNQWVEVTGKAITRGPVTAPASDVLPSLHVSALLHRHCSLNSDVCNLILATVSLMFSVVELVYPVYFQSNI